MKKLLIAVMLLTLVSCDETNLEAKEAKITGYFINANREPLDVITVDGCQYLYGDWGSGSVLTHKGDCNNSIHKPKSE